ncbi:Dehydrogenase (flavoprotein) [Anaerobranca californiensis DSM 14826]|jgi:flavin-dependent dehydrogenase|uniref:Dehydrogenase (Flavoprotein) n=1 Tax=Anaerobranca californiensis DSM 14826 TaxID=1120989 RepID=A0A1M6P1H3_9FIRM|nr:NAD(P)-binding protein [Anaerobranca californiensis]SHK01776.1 Dehydrogenase (flavoprotein) [Anaerobranca californiensis DSM 14826]
MKDKKRIAIIGAGAAGLMCAYELGRLGYTPDIYEIQDRIGGQGFDHTLGWMKVMYRPLKDPLVFFKKKYNLSFKPLNEIHRVKFYSKNNSAILEGKLGYIHLSGPDKQSIYYQIYPHIKNCNIKFGEVVNFRQLNQDYDVVVMANGYSELTELCGLWNTDVAGFVRGATVYGRFQPNTVYMWFNTDFAQHAYAYFIPWNEKKGSLILNMLETTVHGADICWKRFLSHINWDIEISDIWETIHALGHVDKYFYDNIIITGGAAGLLDPIFGFGNVESLDSGGAAARHIAGIGDYHKDIAFWRHRNDNALILRRYIDKFTDEDFDKMLELIKTPMFRTLAINSPFNMVSILPNVIKKVVSSEKIERILYPGTKEVVSDAKYK